MNGIILLEKEINKTSRDMVNKLNHIFHIKKIGHTGTLDPLATGILVMCIGRYTKLVDHLSSMTKEYIATIKLGIKTDTLDITGNIIEERKCTITKEEIINEFNSLIGKFNQEIPVYSAKKINGKKLYEYARNNEEVILPMNTVEIYELELLNITDDEIKFRTLVSKGTYIRSLIDKICNDLNIIGTMSSLVRTKQGKFNLKDAYSISDIENNNYKLLKAKDLFDYPIYELNEEGYKRAINGNFLNIDLDSNYVIVTYLNNEIAIYKKEINNKYLLDVMLVEL